MSYHVDWPFFSTVADVVFSSSIPQNQVDLFRLAKRECVYLIPNGPNLDSLRACGRLLNTCSYQPGCGSHSSSACASRSYYLPWCPTRGHDIPDGVRCPFPGYCRGISHCPNRTNLSDTSGFFQPFEMQTHFRKMQVTSMCI